MESEELDESFRGKARYSGTSVGMGIAQLEDFESVELWSIKGGQ